MNSQSVAVTSPTIIKTEEFDLSDRQDLFIDLIHARPFLWDPLDDHYSNRVMKSDGWREIGTSINMSDKEAKTEYQKLRAKFNRIKNRKLPSGKGVTAKDKKTNDQQRTFISKLSFLSASNVIRQGSGNFESEILNDGASGSGTTQNMEEEILITSSESEDESCHKKVKDEKGENETPKPKKMLEKFLHILEKPEDENQCFGQFIAASLTRLGTKRGAVAKCRIMQCLADAETEIGDGQKQAAGSQSRVWSPLDL